MSAIPIEKLANDNTLSPQDNLLDQGGAEDLKGRAMRGGATVLATQGIKFAMQFGGIAILSRLLGPAEFGVVAMVTAFTGLAVVLKDAGLSQSTVQRAQITQGEVSTLFWLNAGAGLIIFGILCCLAPVITWFYGDSRLTSIAIASSWQFVFAGLSVQHLALLNRKMQFRKLAMVEIISLAAGFLTGIAMAARGYGYWALVWMPIVASIAAALAAWTLSPWRPSRPRFDRGATDMLRMGGNLAGFNIVNYFARNMDNSLIGWRWGPEALGFYSRSYSLFTLPLSQINAPLAQVAIAGLSRTQDDPSRFASYYKRAVVLSMSLTTPLAAFTIVAAPEIIAVVLGRQWMECVPIFRWLGLGGLFQPLCNSTGWIYISTGRSDRMFHWGIFASLVYCLSFFAGLPFGARGVAIAYTCAVIVLFWPCIAFATRGTSIQPGRLLLAVLPPVVSAVAAALICAFAKWLFLQRTNDVLSTATMATVMIGAYSTVLLCLFKQKALYKESLDLLFRKAASQHSKV